MSEPQKDKYNAKSRMPRERSRTSSIFADVTPNLKALFETDQTIAHSPTAHRALNVASGRANSELKERLEEPRRKRRNSQKFKRRDINY